MTYRKMDMENTPNSSTHFQRNDVVNSTFENPLHVGYIRVLFIMAFSTVCLICLVGRYTFYLSFKEHE